MVSWQENLQLVSSDMKAENPSAPAKILIVDDDLLILGALEQTLLRQGYDVLKASSGKEALALLQEQMVALIICDQKMPEMSGIETLRQAQQIRPDAIRIALTGTSERETVINAINIGQVSHFISKPWEDAVLNKIVTESLEKYRLIHENRLLHRLLFKQNKELEKANQSLRSDLKLGARIHEELLIAKIPQDIPGITFAIAAIPSAEIDGDFFDFYHPVPHILDIVMGDVMGKGIPAALIGTAIKTHLQRFAVPLSHVKYCDTNAFWLDDLFEPQDVIKYAHAQIATQLIKLEFFATLFYGRFDLAKQTLSFVDCGATKPIHYKAKDQTIQFLKGCDFPIGMVEKNDYHKFETAFDDDDIFIFYSDGVTETRSLDGVFFGIDKLLALVSQYAKESADYILSRIKESVQEHAQKEYFADDMTLLVVKMQKDEQHHKNGDSLSAAFLSDLSQLAAVRGFVKRACNDIPGDSRTLNQLMELIIDEAFCNIVNHGYKGIEGQKIFLKVQYQKEGIWFELSDQGEYFDPRTIPEPSLIGHDEGGYGLYIIRKMSDQVAYMPKTTHEGWNHLRVYKRYIYKEVPMDFNHTTQDNVLVVSPIGPSLDAREAREFKEKITHLISQNEAHSIVIDMSNLQFIDSSGLGTFLSILKAMHLQNGELKLANLNKPIRTIFELVSMHKIFEIYNTTEEAVVSFI